MPWTLSGSDFPRNDGCPLCRWLWRPTLVCGRPRKGRGWRWGQEVQEMESLPVDDQGSGLGGYVAWPFWSNMVTMRFLWFLPSLCTFLPHKCFITGFLFSSCCVWACNQLSSSKDTHNNFKNEELRRFVNSHNIFIEASLRWTNPFVYTPYLSNTSYLHGVETGGNVRNKSQGDVEQCVQHEYEQTCDVNGKCPRPGMEWTEQAPPRTLNNPYHKS